LKYIMGQNHKNESSLQIGTTEM